MTHKVYYSVVNALLCENNKKGDIICKVNCGIPQSLFGPVFMGADVACISFINYTYIFKIYSPLISDFLAGIKLLVLSLLYLVPFLFVDNYFTCIT